MSDSPEVAILQNDAALHSLKRPQLLALTKRFGLKGSGKNVDLVARLKEHGAFLLANSWDTSVVEAADASTASWAVVSAEGVPAKEDELAEFGVQGTSSSNSTLTSSSSTTSIASTIREKGASLLRALVDTGRREDAVHADAQGVSATSSPAAELELAAAEPPYQDEPQSADEGQEDGGIRLVSSRSTLADTSMASVDSPGPSLPTASPCFVFGSPSATAAPPSSAFTFTSMPGSLFASTSSTASASACAEPVTASESTGSAMDSILAEMNRRAAESRATAPLPRSNSSLFASSSTCKPASPSKGSKAAFDMSHKRGFDKMDSIATHWAAKKRTLPPSASSSSIGNLAGVARSASSRSISGVAVSGAAERAPKRLKPSTSKPFGLSRLASSAALSSVASSSSSSTSATDQKLVAALRDQGWSSAPAPKAAVSLSASIRGAQPGRPKEVREDVMPVQEQERAQRKRQMELAKARRKSQMASGVGLSRRRPSLGVGPKTCGSAASRLFKSAVRKFTPSTSASSSTRPALPASTSSRTLVPSTSTRTLPTSASTSAPRFAASTAASSSRTAAAPASPPKKPQQQPGWKKFDLQASLQRPMPWKSHLAPGGSAASPAAPASSPAAARPSAAFAPASASRRPTAAASGSLQRTASTRVVNQALLSPVRPGRVPEETAVPQATAEEKLAALPAAPTSPFGAVPTPFQPLTNIAGGSSAPSAPAGVWQPPAVTKKPVLPSSSASAPTAASTSTYAASAPKQKKLVSSSTRAARGGDTARGKAQVEGLESRARKVRATAAAAASAKAKSKGRAEQ